MATSYAALCTDFYVNQKLAMKMELPDDRETVLHMFDRVRKSVPSMDRFRRYEGELSLESPRRDPEYRWLSVCGNDVRTGHVNPESMDEVYRLHRLVLEMAPYHLTISPLDVDHLELMFGFDLECRSNHDVVVADALFANTPMSDLLRMPQTRVLELQPAFGVSLSESGDLQAYFDVKTRRKSRRGRAGRYRDEPISILLTVRKYGPVQEVSDLVDVFSELASRGEVLLTERLVPSLLLPISRQIASSSA